MQSSMPDTNSIALAVLFATALIVIYDGWKLYRANRDIPTLGKFSNGGMAWESQMEQEFVRNITMIGSIVVMMITPWFLADRSGTNIAWVVIFDILLALHTVWLITPKRYAVTRDALWVDGFRVDWSRLWWSGWKGGSSITLQRKGWWRLAPLPIGGNSTDLESAALRIDAILANQWDELVEILSEEE